MNLSETDKELIAEIVEQKLRHYKLIGEPAVGVNEVYGPTLQSDLVENIPQLIKKPAVDVVEPYFNCVLECVERRDGLTIGKMYKPQGFNKFTSDYLVIDDRGVKTWFGLQTFIRHKEAQQKEVEKELSEPKQEERWRPSTGEKYFYITDAIYVYIFI